jgi:hypothetical protein
VWADYQQPIGSTTGVIRCAAKPGRDRNRPAIGTISAFPTMLADEVFNLDFEGSTTLRFSLPEQGTLIDGPPLLISILRRLFSFMIMRAVSDSPDSTININISAF